MMKCFRQMLGHRTIFRLSLFVLLAACRSKTPPPGLPQIDGKGFQPAVRQVIEAAERAARSKPDDSEAVAALGMVLHAHNAFSEAALCYQRAHALNPSKFDYAYYWGSALVASGKYDEAVTPLRRALDINAKHIPARMKLAEALLAAGHASGAASEYRKVLSQDDSLAAAHYGLGRTQTGADAIASFSKALSLFPRYGAAQFALAAAYRKAGETAKATQALEGYEQNKSNAPLLEDPLMSAVYSLNTGTSGLLRQAQILDRENRLSEAVALHERALEQDPKLAQAWINLISLHGRMGHADKAEEAFRKAIAADPNQADAWYNYGVLLVETQRMKDGQKSFEKAIQLDPRHVEALHNLGTVIETEGQWDRAAQLYLRALAVMPEHRKARFKLGRIYANQKRFADAIAQFEKIREPVDSETPTFLYALAATHARSGNRAQAIAILRTARVEAARFGQVNLVSSIDRDLAALGAKP